MVHHGRGLRSIRRDEAWVVAVAHDYRAADLDARQRAMCDWAVRATLAPAGRTAADLDVLRAHGLSDRDLLDLAQVVGYYNYANRLVDMLGVALEDPDDAPFAPAPGLREALLAELGG